MRKTVAELKGAYALAVISEKDPDCIVLAREGCPVVVGLGIDENFVASDVAALVPVTRRFMFLEEGDVAEIRRKSVDIVDSAGSRAERPVRESDLSADAVERGQYRHFMLKEIHEQPRAVAQTLEERVAGTKLFDAAFGPNAADVFKRVKAVHIAACGTSYHAGLVASYFLEQVCRIRRVPRSPANTAIETRLLRRTRYSSRFHNPARPRIPWRRCATPGRRSSRRSRSAMWPKARWCGSRIWCC